MPRATIEDKDRNLVQGIRDHYARVAQAARQVCLDLGHVRAYGQEALLESPALTGRVTLLHLSAARPGKDLHRSLAELDPEGHELLRRALAATPPDAALMPEIFALSGFEASLDILHRALTARLSSDNAAF